MANLLFLPCSKIPVRHPGTLELIGPDGAKFDEDDRWVQERCREGVLAPVAPGGSAEGDNDEPKLEDMTKAQLVALCEAREIAVPSGASKGALVELLS